MTLAERAFRVCTDCAISHIENCPDCFGFGLFVSERTGDLIPVIAGEAHGTIPMPKNVIPCPSCSSTEKGLPGGGAINVVKYEYKPLLKPGEID